VLHVLLKFANWPYPVLAIKASLAALMILLAFALMHGRKYFHARDERCTSGNGLVEESHYAEALPLPCRRHFGLPRNLTRQFY